MSKLKEISFIYGVPAKRGQIVTYGTGRDADTGHILSASRDGHYLNIAVGGHEIRITNVHPLELDYLINGEWISRVYFTKRHNERWDAWNKVMGRKVAP